MEIKANFKLPFKLPIKDGLKLLSSYNFANLCTVFESVQNEVELLDNNAKVINSSLNITYFPCNGLENENNKQTILYYFVINTIWYINRIIDSFRITFGLSHLRNITIRDLPTAIIIELDNDTFAYLTNTEFMNEDLLVIDNDGISKISSTLTSMDLYPDIYLVENFYESAKTHLYRENFIRAIIDLQTSFEIFIRNTLRLILTKQGSSKDLIEKASSIPFRNVIEQELSSYLKENLKFNNAGPIKEWNQDLYLLRNKIVHSGFTHITGKESILAIESYEKARNFISDLLIREGYLSKDGKIGLKLFQKNEYDLERGKNLVKLMKEKGLIPEDIKFVE
ncbi:MAG: hypothetical protein HPY60_11150 [Candidatus Methanofastidiosum sp.]|nr:hypothetical protein [Methanofastidiosum sp.]